MTDKSTHENGWQAALDAKGFTQARFAKLAKVSASYVSHVCAGRKPAPEKMMRAARKHGLKIKCPFFDIQCPACHEAMRLDTKIK